MADAWETTDAYAATDTQQDPFAQSHEEGFHAPHTPPPVPPDDGNEEAQSSNPNRVPSATRLDRQGSINDSALSQDSSIFAQAGENPLVPHHHPHRVEASDPPPPGTHPNPPAPGMESDPNPDDPFARHDDNPFSSDGHPTGMPPLDLKRVGSVSGRRPTLNRSGSLAQPSLHEIMFQQKREGKGSLESRMLSTSQRNRSDSQSDPFAGFGGQQRGSFARSGSMQDFGGIQRMNSIGGASSTTPEVVVKSTSPSAAAANGDFTSEERHAAEGQEELFMPNMKREQFIPVRVARDKIKQVLAEMAQMKSLHLAALDTMEKQHAFLKAQLESATATYVKKLTRDYNSRVTALEAEYKRRLEHLNSNAMNDLGHNMDEAKRKVALLEERAMQKVKDRERELEQEQKMFLAKLEHDRGAVKEFQQQVRERDAQIEELEQRIRELESSRSTPPPPPPQPSTPPPSNDEETQQVKAQLVQLQDAYDAEVSARQEFERQAESLHEQLIEARRKADQSALAEENQALRTEIEALKAQLA